MIDTCSENLNNIDDSKLRCDEDIQDINVNEMS